MRFYANAKQRTIATAQYFSSGFLPVADIDIITRQEYDKMDPVFTPQLTFVNDAYLAERVQGVHFFFVQHNCLFLNCCAIQFVFYIVPTIPQ